MTRGLMSDQEWAIFELGTIYRRGIRRKKAYEAFHPETRNGAIGNGREKLRQVGEATSDRFTADTAAKTGQSERTVQRDAKRGGIDMLVVG